MYHQYESCRSAAAVKKLICRPILVIICRHHPYLYFFRYCTKEGNFDTNLDRSSLLKVNCWQEARATARSGDLMGAMEILENSPQGAMNLCTRGKTIRKELKRLLPPRPVPPLPLIRDLTDFQYPEWNREKSLIITGMSGMGKTSLACSLIPSALMVTTLEDLKRLNPKRHTGIIFDDMAMPKERETQLALLDRTKPTSIEGVRYKNPKIPLGIPTIFCTNFPVEMYLIQVLEVMRRVEVWTTKSCGVFEEKIF